MLCSLVQKTSAKALKDGGSLELRACPAPKIIGANCVLRMDHQVINQKLTEFAKITNNFTAAVLLIGHKEIRYLS